MKRIQLDWICSTCDLIRELGLSPSVERKVKKDAGDADFYEARDAVGRRGCAPQPEY